MRFRTSEQRDYGVTRDFFIALELPFPAAAGAAEMQEAQPGMDRHTIRLCASTKR